MVASSLRPALSSLRRLTALILLALPAASLQAVDVTWLGTTNAWTTTTNWSSGALPGTADRAVFGTPGAPTTSVSNGGDKTVGGILFNGNANYTININSGVIYVGNQGIEVTSGTQNFSSGNLRLNVGGATTILNNGTLNFNSGLMYHRTAGSGDKVLTFDGSGATTVSAIERRNNTFDMSLVKNGSGTLTINGASAADATSTTTGSISGSTTINAGKVRINTEGALGGNPAAFNAGQLTLNGGTLNAFGSFTIDDSNRGLTLGASGGTLEVDSTFTLTVANKITGTGALNKLGAGTLVLSGDSDYAGTTTITAGILELQHSNALGSTAGGVTVNSGTTLRLLGNIAIGAEALTLNGTGVAGQGGALVNVSGINSFGGQLTLGSNTTIASLSGDLNLTSAAAVIGGSKALTLTGTGNGSLAGGMDTSITALTKSGSGNWTLSGTNTYTGATSVTAGTLTIDSTGSLGSTAVTVSSGATLNVLGNTNTAAITIQGGATLAGSGTIGSSITIPTNSTLSPGSSLVAGSAGTLSISGALNLNNETLVNYNLGSSSDQVAVTGNLLLNGILRITQGSGFGASSSYTLFTYGGTLADANLALATPLSGYNYALSTATAGQVNLLVNQTGLQFWDGSNTSANGILDGGTGVWSNVPANTNWTAGDGNTNTAWTSGQTAVFMGAAGNVQVADTMVIGGLQFATSDNLTDAGGNVGKLSLSNAATEIRVDPSITATIAVPLIGTGGIIKASSGILNLTAPSTYAGPTVVKEGTLQIGVTNALPTTTALTVGSDGITANLDANNFSQTVSSLEIASNASGTSLVTIGSGQTFTVNGSNGFKVGVANNYKAKTNVTFSGGGALVVNNTSAIFEAGLQSNTSSTVGPGGDSPFDSTSNTNTSTASMTGLSSVSVTVNAFRVGFGLNNNSSLSLSNTANTINANSLQIANSNGLNQGTGISSLILGAGTNVFQIDSLTVGTSKGTGEFKFLSQTAGSPGTVIIGGKTIATTNITLGFTNGTATGSTPTGTLDLRGHTATVTANNLILGKRDASGNGGATGVINFDSGTFSATTVTLGAMSGDALGTAAGTLLINGGTFTINSGGSFKLATFGNTNTSGKAQGTLTLTGGTLISNVDLQEGGGTFANTTNTVSTVTLDGGILDMTGHSIGSAANTINTFTLASGILKDVSEINGGAAISKTTGGTLILQGNNSYTGSTTVSTGTLLINNTYTSAATATGSNTLSVNSSTTLGGQGRIDGAVTLSTGATLAPGGNATTIAGNVSGLNSDIGTMRINNTLSVNSSATINLQLKTNGAHGLLAMFDPSNGMLTSVSGTSLDGGNDRLLVSGDLALDANSKIALTFGTGYTPAPNDVFDLIDWFTINSLGSIPLAFYDFGANGRRTGNDNQSYGLSLPSLDPLNASSGQTYYWDVSQFGSTGVISITPEPSRALLLLSGVGLMCLRRRRRSESSR